MVHWLAYTGNWKLDVYTRLGDGKELKKRRKVTTAIVYGMTQCS